MAEDYCGPYVQCAQLDGRLLINQTLHGPALADPGDIGIGDLKGRGVLRPYVRFVYEQRWNVKESCQAPVRSIIGLAPGETMKLDTRQVEQFDFTRMVQDASEQSEVVTTSGPASQMRDVSTSMSQVISLPVRVADRFGSFWEIAGAVVGAVV